MTHNEIEELFKGHFRSAVFISQMIVNSKEVAEDIVQDVFVKLLDIDIKSGGSVVTLLYTSVKNASIDYTRTKAIRINEPIINAHIPDNTNYELSSEEIEYADKLRRVILSIEALPEQSRNVVKLICLNHYSYSDTADKLGISVSTVKTHMYRSFKIMRKHLLDIATMAITLLH